LRALYGRYARLGVYDTMTSLGRVGARWRALRPGGRLAALAPSTNAINRYVAGWRPGPDIASEVQALSPTHGMERQPPLVELIES
jgi:hypothetical protein